MSRAMDEAARRGTTLPPGQRAVEGFPRFGTHLHRPPPAVPADPLIEIDGAVTEPLAVPLTRLATLPRRELNADFHCVAGWSATNLHWEGVEFETFYRMIIEPSVEPGAAVTHLVFGGLDGFESSLLLTDALAEDVVLAEHLNGRPLDADHGAPLRLVSPNQYGYVNVKHVCRIEVHTSEPAEELGSATRLSQVVLRGPLIKRHPRARVWEEERHPDIPARWLRPIYRAVIPPGIWLSARGSRRGGNPPPPQTG